MLRTLVFAGIAAAVGRKLYQSGAIKRFGDDLKARSEELKTNQPLGSTTSAARVNPDSAGAPRPAGPATATI